MESGALTPAQPGKEVIDAAYELRRAALKQLPPAATLRGDELGETSDKKELRIRVKAYMRENLIKPNLKVINEQTGYEIGFDGTSVDRATNINSEDLLRTFPALPQMLRKATLVRREGDRYGRKDIKAIYRFVSAANLGNKRIDVELIVREKTSGLFQYSVSYALNPE